MAIFSRAKTESIRNLILYVIRHKPVIIGTTLIGIVSSGIEVAAIGSLIPISILASGQSIGATSIMRRLPASLGFQPDVKFYAALFVVLLITRTLSNAINNALIYRTYRWLIAHFVSRALESFVWHLSFSDIQKHAVGHFVTLAGDESNRAAQIIMYVMRLVPITALLAFYLLALFLQSWVFGLMLVGFFLVTIACLWEAFRISLRLGRLQQDQTREASTHLLESLNGLRTVRGFNGEEYVSSRFRKMMEDYTWTCLQIDFVNLASRAVPTLLLLSLTLLIITQFMDVNWFAQNLALLFVGVMMVMRLLPLAGLMLDYSMRLISDLRAAENVGTMLTAVEAAMPGKNGTSGSPTQRIERIEFDRVSFRYTPETPAVLKDFSTVFEAGKSYAIVGPSGIGKSSLIDLLLKFYDIDSGSIRINGQDASGIPAAWIRSRAALAEQTTRLFYDTVLRNVLFGREASREAGAEALRLVGLADFLATLPDGVDAMVSYQGSNFSGGQRQRVGLARALLEPADVLIIDEGTSALDQQTKLVVLESILQRYRDKIVLFITHDQAVMDGVDVIVRIPELGARAPNPVEPAPS